MASNKQPNVATEMELAGVHPGERLPGESAIDEALVAQAVADINAIYAAKGLETARAVGEYVIAKFFDGHLSSVKAKGNNHLSFSALARHPDLAVGRSTLWYSVALLGQLRELPSDIAESLPFSHHKLLLSVKDPQAKLDLAAEAVQSGIGKRNFEARVREVRDERWSNGGKPGRQALPAWAKGFDAARRVFEVAASGEIRDEDLVHHGKGLVQARLADVTATIEILEGLQAKLRAALEQAG